MTTRQTLGLEPRSFLCCQEDPGLDSDNDETGAYLPDRNPTYLGLVLNYPVTGSSSLGRSWQKRRLEEAEFYNIASLLRLVLRKGYRQGKQLPKARRSTCTESCNAKRRRSGRWCALCPTVGNSDS